MGVTRPTGCPWGCRDVALDETGLTGLDVGPIIGARVVEHVLGQVESGDLVVGQFGVKIIGGACVC